MTPHENHLSRCLALADRWRHLPSYQLERRIDLLLAPLLPGLVQRYVADPQGISLSPIVIPELPVRYSVWKNDVADSLSQKIDYCFLSSPPGHAILLELKTDMGSFNTNQDECLRALDGGDFNDVALGICRLCIDTEEDAKYFHLMSFLRDAGILRLPDSLESRVFPARSRGVAQAWGEVRTTQPHITIHVRYLQPTLDGVHNALSFEQLADYVESDTGAPRELGVYIRKWILPPAMRPPDQPV